MRQDNVEECAAEVAAILAEDPEGGPALLLGILQTVQRKAFEAELSKRAAVIEATALMAGYGAETKTEGR